MDFSRVRAVVTDVDGTLAGADNQVSPRTLDALRQAQRAGMLVVIVTGRTPQSAWAIARDAGLVAPVLSCNGSLVLDAKTGDVLRADYLPHEEVLEVLDLAAKHDVMSTWWTREEVFVSREGFGKDLLEELNGEPAVIGDPAQVRPGAVLKAMLCGTAEELDPIEDDVRARLPRVTRSMGEFLELSSAEGNKWAALKRLLDEYGIAPEDCVGFGDGGNDVPWLREIGFPVAVANARQEVKDVAIAVTGHHDDEAVADFLERNVLVHV